MKRYLFAIVLILFASVVFGQSMTYLDSLTNLLPKLTDPEKKLETAYKISDWYRINENFEVARLEAKSRLTPMESQTKNGYWTTKFYSLIANTYISQEHYDSAQLYIEKARIAADLSKNKYARAYVLYAEMLLQLQLSNNKESLYLQHRILDIIESDDQEIALKTKVSYFMYAVYSDIDDFDQSLKYAGETIRYAEKSGNKNDLANAYSALSTGYKLKYQKDRNPEDLDKMMDNIETSIAISRDYPDQVAVNSYTLGMINKASYLFQFFDIQDNSIRKEVSQLAEKVITLSEGAEASSIPMANAYGILSDLNRQNGNIRAAEDYLKKAYNHLIKSETPYYYTLLHVVENLAELNFEKGNLEKAYKYRSEANTYIKQMYDQEEVAALKRVEAQFQLKNKDKEIRNLQILAASQKRQKTLYLVLMGIGVLGAFFMFRSYNFRLKYSLTKGKQLEAEQQEAELKLKLQKEEEHRLRTEKELAELKQQQLQDEVLVSQLHLQHKKEILQELNEKIDNNKELKKILKEENQNDENFEDVQFRIKSIHPKFFQNLQEQAGKELTTLDQKHCAYLYLGMGTKEIAQLLNIEPKSVRMAKYRLKKKFNLSDKTSLEGFISKQKNIE